MVEELLKNQVNKKGRVMSSEVVDLRKKGEKLNKFLNSSTICARYQIYKICKTGNEMLEITE
jgi:hypothetical protein